jgi:hypothetical protein
MEGIKPLKTMEEVFPLFRFKNKRAFNYRLNQLQSIYPNEHCLTRFMKGKQRCFTENDIYRIRELLCSNLQKTTKDHHIGK